MIRPFLPGIVLFTTLCAACGSAEHPAARDSMTIDSHIANASTPTDDQEALEEESAAQDREDILASGACDSDEASFDCKVWLPTMNGTNNCFAGTQVCVDGEWSPCMSDEDAAEMISEASP